VRRNRIGTYAALSGVLAVGVMFGTAELAAALAPDGRSLVVAVGDAVIDLSPGFVERFAISTLGSADKPFLLASILLVSALLGAKLGQVGVRHFGLAAAGLSAMMAVGVAASLADPQSTAVSSLVGGLAGAAAGIGTLWVLRGAIAAPGAPGEAPVRSPGAAAAVDRRRFLGLAVAAGAVAALGAYGGRLLSQRERVAEIRRSITIPRPATAAQAIPAGADLQIPGLAPLVVPNDDFYRIDTALLVPQVDPAHWSLEVTGMVERPFRLTYEELLSLPQLEAYVTLACVSNEVGGELVGNALWQGVRLRDLLDRARPRREATQVLGRSVDGFTAGFPIEAAFDVEAAMVAIAMNGEPLPVSHGFPARIVVPGLYGYVSATKWLSRIELTRFDEVDGYWIPRGWAKEGPIKTQSRIDVVRPDVIAGVAWAPTRGIERVEVRVDDGPWREATLAAALDLDSWRQWRLAWQPEPGTHELAVRATDGTGTTQTEERTDVAPDGATGWHTVGVTV
jgi:DMSO/TMAO reductase YedYZ molybdopterin-dependent catalytic subunit